MPAKAGIQIREIPGFRVALPRESGDRANVPGMTVVFCRELRLWDTREIII
jgi:hypothetical protein